MKLFAGIVASAFLFGATQTPEYVSPFRKTGNKVVYVFSDHRSPDVLRYDHTLYVRSVKKNGNLSVVNAVMGFTENEIYEPHWYMKFAYDSLNFYVFTVNRLYPHIPENDDKRIVMEGDSLIYPYNMHVGDSLPEGYGTLTEVDSEYKIITDIEVCGRYVSKLDTLELAFGKVAAYKIESTEKCTDRDESGITGKTKRTRTEWFSPQYGIVKVHAVLDDGTYTETTLFNVPE